MSKKGIYLDVVDFGVLREMLSRPPVYVNDLDTIVVENKQALNDLLITRYESDTLESMPICECKATYGAEKAGRICPECGHTVMVPTERPIESRLWIRAPKGVKGLINPLAWNILTKAFKVEGISMVEYLTGLVKPDPRKKPNSAIEKFRAIGVQPGINYFIDNFDMLIDFMLTARMTSKNRVEREKLRAFIERNKLKFFPQALPIPSKLAFIVESTETGTFADSSMGDALDAVRTITRLAHAPRAPSLPERELAAARCCSQLATFYERQVSQALGPKKGLLRRHVFGSRPPFSCRAVITSIPEAHHYQEVHFPWGMSVQLFEEHLKSKLDRLGYSFSVIRKILSRAVLTYSPLIDHLMKEIIAESPVGVTRENGELAPGMPILLQRNPTLKRLSAQYVFITKVKTDPSINTISMSTLILKGPNADKRYRIPSRPVKGGVWKAKDFLGSLRSQTIQATSCRKTDTWSTKNGCTAHWKSLPANTSGSTLTG